MLRLRTLIFVVGMGRSGTSALTRLLSLSGATLPETVNGADAGNPTGHWEPSLALRINELYLSSGQSSFWDVGLRLQTDTGSAASDRARFVGKIKWFLQLELARGEIFVLKDPRTSVLLDCWLKAAVEAGFACKVIHIFRHPEEVAASLKARDQLDRRHAFLLWTKYNLLSERYARGFPRMFVSYEDVLRDPQTLLRHAISTLELDLTLPSAQAVQGFLSPGLRHHASPSPSSVVDDPTPGRLAERLFAMLGCAAAGNVDTAGMDRLFDEFASFEAAQRGDADRPWTAARVLDFLRYTQPGLHLHRWRRRVLGASKRRAGPSQMQTPQSARE